MSENNMDQNYWRSFSELYNNEKFTEENQNEFLDGASSAPDLQGMSPLSRRRFVGLMSASAALAGTACSNYRDEGELIPHNDQTETTTPGKAYSYASTLSFNGMANPVLIKVREGRPIKINGNSLHPVSKGSVSAPAQAMLMSLYDPERLKKPLLKGKKSTWEVVDEEVKKALTSAVEGSKKVVFLGNKNISPALQNLIEEFKAGYEKTEVFSYDLGGSNAYEAAWKSLYGEAALERRPLDKAELVVAFEADFLGTEALVDEKIEFAKGRDIVASKKQNKLFVVEGDMSTTGMSADERIPLRTDAIELLLAAVLAELLSKNVEFKDKLDGASIQAIANHSFQKTAGQIGLDKKSFDHLIAEILKAKGKAVIKVGQRLGEQAQIAGILINELIGGKATAKFAPLVQALSSKDEISSLIAAMNAGEVGIVFHTSGNPSYHLNNDSGFVAAYEKVFSVSFVESENETSAASNVVIATSHALESWGDSQDRAGVINLQQPVIAPIFKTRSLGDCLVSYLKNVSYSDVLFREYLKNFWQTKVYAESKTLLDAKTFWNTALHDGFMRLPVGEVSKELNPGALANFAAAKPGKAELLVLKPAAFIRDGAFANIGWLQETPNPVSKVTWDNYAAMSIGTMRKLGLRLFPTPGHYKYEMVSLEVNGKSVKLPAFTQPGIPDGMVVVELGYGRQKVGVVGQGAGFDVIPLMSSKGQTPWIQGDVKYTATKEEYVLACTQEHNAVTKENIVSFSALPMFSDEALREGIEDAHFKRMIIQEGTIEDYKANENFLHEHKHYPTTSLDRPHKYEGVKWGMAIDLNKCTGCGDCVISCNVENNIPVVGKDQVAVGREMHWMRIDRYYSGTPENPKASIQPMLCQHCDNAPCENVCPVVATTHSPEGINEMTYNRCVGTRYCANNCPYKVRRFNFYNFRDHFKAELQQKPVFALLHNPEVTVRSRGVMEKCTFCVQRVNSGRAESKRNKTEWVGQGVETACQEVCSANAISFGNLNDADSKVAKLKVHKLTYRVLDETGVESNVRYLAKIRNIEGKSHS